MRAQGNQDQRLRGSPTDSESSNQADKAKLEIAPTEERREEQDEVAEKFAESTRGGQ